MTTTTSTPPQAAALVFALDRLPAGTPRRVALMHLVTPAEVVPGIGITFTAGRYHYRGLSRPARGDDAVTVATDLHDLVCSAHAPTDRYLDLDADPVGWVKVLRSGFRRIVFGADTLLGAPALSLDDDVPVEAVPVALAAAMSSRLPDGGVVDVAGTAVVVEAAEHAWVLHGPANQRATAPAWSDPRGSAVHAAAVATELRTLLGAHDMRLVAAGSRFEGTEDFLATLRLAEGWTAQVPVTIAPGSQLVGASADEVLVCPEEPLPAGFRWLGRAMWDGAAVARHDRADVVALLHAPASVDRGHAGTVTA